ncbi:MAG: thioredoxin family protein, partial [Patescibacteria group bacterium]
MTIKILGTGCPNCQKLTKNVEEAIISLGLSDITIEKVEDIDKIIGMGVMSTPALAIDNEVKSSGRILSIEEIKDLLK